MNVQTKMTKGPVIIDIKPPRIQSEIAFKVTAADLPSEGCVRQSCLYKISRPLLWAMCFCGKMHYSIGDDGWMKTSFFSLSFAYSLAVLIANVAFHLYYRQELQLAFRELSDAITFSHVLFATMILLQTIGTFVTVYSWVFEIPSVVNNYNTNAALQEKLSGVFSSFAMSPFGRRTASILQIVSFVTMFTFDQVLTIMRYKDKPIPMVFILMFNLSGSQLYMVMWCLNNCSIGAMAGKLRVHMLQLGDEFLNDLIHLDKEDMDRECFEEVEDFTHLILRTDKAQFTLKCYLTVGRPLFVSFISTTVTYLIVLLQFQQGQAKINHT